MLYHGFSISLEITKSMRTLLALVVLVILVGGGYYWYSQNAATMNDTDVTDPFGNTNTPATNTNTNTGTSTGVNIGIDGSVATGTKEFTVSNSGMTFNPKTLSVKEGERVKITFRNTGGTHDLRIDGYDVGTKVIQAGQSESFEFVANEAGTFEYYCSVGNHREMGMVGTLTVTE
jgi:plastocyanin